MRGPHPGQAAEGQTLHHEGKPELGHGEQGFWAEGRTDWGSESSFWWEMEPKGWGEMGRGRPGAGTLFLRWARW